MKTTITAERELDADADLLYHLLADYTAHHRPEGFLPPAFSDLQVLAGGVGAGTEATWNVETNGARRFIHARITEPEPGHTLLETADGLVTRFTVDPTPHGARVRFETVIDEPGVRGVVTRLLAPRMLAALYEDELTRLGEYARTHGPLDV
jgi:hypothetical protein